MPSVFPIVYISTFRLYVYSVLFELMNYTFERISVYCWLAYAFDFGSLVVEWCNQRHRVIVP